MTSNTATPLSHFLSRAAVDKLPQSVYRFHLLETAGSRKVPEIKGFRVYFPSTLDINTTVSTWADNIMIERWFRSLKTDLIYINEFHSPRELRQAIEKYVQEYNSVRPHQSLGNATPDAVFQTCFQIGT